MRFLIQFMEPSKKNPTSANLSEVFSQSPLLSEPMKILGSCPCPPAMHAASPLAHPGMHRFVLQLSKSSSLHGIPAECPSRGWVLLLFGKSSGKVTKSGCKCIPQGVRAIETSAICLAQSRVSRQDQLPVLCPETGSAARLLPTVTVSAFSPANLPQL